MKKNSLLSCSNCGSEWFNQVQVGKYPSNLLDFIIKYSPIETKVAYLCAECGFIVDSLDEPETVLIVITGNSEGYKRKGLIHAGYEPSDNLQFDDYLVQDEFLFVIKDYWKKHQEELSQMIEGTIIKVFETYKSDYDNTELKNAIKEMRKE